MAFEFDDFLKAKNIPNISAYRNLAWSEQKDLEHEYFRALFRFHEWTKKKTTEEEPSATAIVAEMKSKPFTKEEEAEIEKNLYDIEIREEYTRKMHDAKGEYYITRDRFVKALEEVKSYYESEGEYKSNDPDKKELEEWSLLREKLNVKARVKPDKILGQVEGLEGVHSSEQIMVKPKNAGEPKAEDYDEIIKEDAFQEDRKYNENLSRREKTVDATEYVKEMLRLNERMKRNFLMTGPMKAVTKMLNSLAEKVKNKDIDITHMKVSRLQDMTSAVMEYADMYVKDKSKQTSYSSTQLERLKCIRQLKTLEESLYSNDLGEKIELYSDETKLEKALAEKLLLAEAIKKKDGRTLCKYIKNEFEGNDRSYTSVVSYRQQGDFKNFLKDVVTKAQNNVPDITKAEVYKVLLKTSGQDVIERVAEADAPVRSKVGKKVADQIKAQKEEAERIRKEEAKKQKEEAKMPQGEILPQKVKPGTVVLPIPKAKQPKQHGM